MATILKIPENGVNKILEIAIIIMISLLFWWGTLLDCGVVLNLSQNFRIAIIDLASHLPFILGAQALFTEAHQVFEPRLATVLFY